MRRHLRRGDYLFRSGEQMDAVYLVCSGFFRRRAPTSARERHCTGAMMVRGDLIGADMLELAQYSSDVVAVDHSDVWMVPRAWLESGDADRVGLSRCLSDALGFEASQWIAGVEPTNIKGIISDAMDTLRLRLDGLMRTHTANPAAEEG